MIKSLQLHMLFKKSAAVSLYNGFHINSVLLATFRKRKIPRALSDKYDERIRGEMLPKKLDYSEEIIDEHELHDDLNMKIDEDHNDILEQQQLKKRLGLKITASKFFSSRPQPLMLTYNERLCIQYLHKEDPVQWDFKTLSESFPATPDTIRKIVKCKRKITPERAKKMDLRVQKNWELLSEGKLDADPHVLEHLKRFVNRRKILLEQIQKETFYLPEIKDEPVWNQGEMSSIIMKYEKDIERLVQEHDFKAITDGSEETKYEKKEEEKSRLDLVHAQIEAESKNLPKTKDSFKFGDMLKTYSKQTTMEEFENKILKKAENREQLDLLEKIILDNKLGVKEKSYDTVTKRSSPSEMQQETTQSFKAEEKVHIKFDKENHLKSSSSRFKRMEPEEVLMTLDYSPPDENTHFGSEADVGKILSDLQSKPQPKKKSEEKEEQEGSKKPEEKKKIDFSDPERIKRENIYYDKEVSDIKNTAFWNNGRNSREKEMAEFEKRDLDGPCVDEYDMRMKKLPKIFILNPDPYPERIRIPKNKRGSGLTFRVKDCYYDDDGEFLYRVPGMTK